MLDLRGFFSAEFYLATYPDVAQAIVLGTVADPLQHFQQWGKFEGRSPSALFDPAFYLATYPDVAAAVAADVDLTGIDHYLETGQGEERSPGPLFDPVLYGIQNPDVAAQLGRDHLTGIEHYVKWGRQEGRSQPLRDRAGETATTAFDLGAFDLGPLENATPRVVWDAVGNTDRRDLYRMTVTQVGEVNLRLDGLDHDADLSISMDFNQDSQVTPDEAIAVAQKDGTSPERFQGILQAGTYYLGVSQYDGTTPYRLTAKVSPLKDLPPDGAGNDLRNARPLGGIEVPQSIADTVGPFDPSDVYRFSIMAPSHTLLRLDGLQADADLALARDADNNGRIDPIEILIVPAQTGTAPEAISLDLPTGEYFASVSTIAGQTSYSLNVVSTPLDITLPGGMPKRAIRSSAFDDIDALMAEARGIIGGAPVSTSVDPDLALVDELLGTAFGIYNGSIIPTSTPITDTFFAPVLAEATAIANGSIVPASTPITDTFFAPLMTEVAGIASGTVDPANSPVIDQLFAPYGFQPLSTVLGQDPLPGILNQINFINSADPATLEKTIQNLSSLNAKAGLMLKADETRTKAMGYERLSGDRYGASFGNGSHNFVYDPEGNSVYINSSASNLAAIDEAQQEGKYGF